MEVERNASGNGFGPLVPGNELLEVGGKLCFRAESVEGDSELWISDGTSAGTQLLKELNPGGAGSYPDWLTVGPNSNLLFIAQSPVGREPWLSDLTEVGPSILAEPEGGIHTGDSMARAVGTLDGAGVIAVADDGVHGMELGTWDSVAGLTLLHDVNPGPAGSNPGSFDSFFVGGQQRSFFTAEIGPGQTDVMVTDGMPGGLTMLVSIADLVPNEAAVRFVQMHDRVYFSVRRDLGGRELWSSDGTVSGTSKLVDLVPGPGSSAPLGMIGYQGRLYFSAFDGSEDEWLWPRM